VWTGATRGGFGTFTLPATETEPRRRIDAHRFAYQHLVGPIPNGHELGHICHAAEAERCDGGPHCPHRGCVNPAHLVAVSLTDAPTGGVPQPQRSVGRPARPTVERFWAMVDRDGPVPRGDPQLGRCWVWTGGTRGGFGAFNLPATETEPRRRIDAHRFVYQTHVGPIPDGHEVGHLCHAADIEHCDGGPDCPHRGCVNPAHLVTVSQAAVPRGVCAVHAAQTRCPQGHPYDHVTAQGRRRCTRCMREQAERYRVARGHPTPAEQDAAVTAWIAANPTPD